MFQTAYQEARPGSREASAVTSAQGNTPEQEAQRQGSRGGTRDAFAARDVGHRDACGGTQHGAASPAAAAVLEPPPAAAAAAAARWRCVAAAEATHVVQRLRRQLRSDKERRSESENGEEAKPSEQLSAAARACGHVVSAFCYASACRTLSFPSESGPGGCAFVSQRVAEMAMLAQLKGLEDDAILALARSSPLPTNQEDEPPGVSLPALLARARAQGAENQAQRERERERMGGRLQHGDRHDVR